MEAAGVLALSAALACAGTSGMKLGMLAFEGLQRGVARLRMSNGGRLPALAELLEAAEMKLAGALGRIPKVRRLMSAIRGERYRQELRSSLPQAVRLLCISLDSGDSLQRSLEYAVKNSSGPVSRELGRAVYGLRAGQSFEEVMGELRVRTGGGEFACLAVAMEIQHRCGGTLSQILESVSLMLQQSSDLEEELVTKTTQAQLSARVVALMPLVVMALLSLVSPGYLSQFFESALGVALLVIAVILELVGVVLVKRTLAVDVDGEGVGM